MSISCCGSIQPSMPKHISRSPVELTAVSPALRRPWGNNAACPHHLVWLTLPYKAQGGFILDDDILCVTDNLDPCPNGLYRTGLLPNNQNITRYLIPPSGWNGGCGE